MNTYTFAVTDKKAFVKCLTAHRENTKAGKNDAPERSAIIFDSPSWVLHSYNWAWGTHLVTPLRGVQVDFDLTRPPLAVSYPALVEAVKKVSGKTFSIMVENGVVSIKDGQSVFYVPFVDAALIPPAPNFPSVPPFWVHGDAIPALYSVLDATCVDTARPVLTCVHIGATNDEYTFWGADGFRAHVTKAPRSPGINCQNDPVNTNIPAHIFYTLKSLGIGKGGIITIWRGPDMAYVTAAPDANNPHDVFVLTCALDEKLDTPYPDLTQVFPLTACGVYTASITEWERVIQSMGGDKRKFGFLKIHAKPDGLDFSLYECAGGAVIASCSLSAKPTLFDYDENGLLFALNARFFAEAIRSAALLGDTVTIVTPCTDVVRNAADYSRGVQNRITKIEGEGGFAGAIMPLRLPD